MPQWDDSPHSQDLTALAAALVLPGATLKRRWLDDELLALWLLVLDDPEAQMTTADIGRLWQQMPYWAFAWAGGRALARHIQQHPQQVMGKKVLDFGCGSAMAGIAAALAGADTVYVSDLDPNALKAAEVNAALNGVRVIPVAGGDEQPDVDLLLAADVLYDTSSHDPLRQLTDHTAELLLAETRGMVPQTEGIRCLDTLQTTTLPSIGDFDQNVTVDIYARLADSPALN